MEKSDIKLGDWMRILVGQVPGSFFIELVIRALIIFVLLVVAMRLFGLRMSAQINRLEMISLFSLAAAIGIPLQSPDRGILPAFVTAMVVVVIGRALAAYAFRHERFEKLSEGNLSLLVCDGVINNKAMHETKMTRERLLSQLRGAQVRHLGEVQRLYFEANGSFTLIRAEQPLPGLCIFPGFDQKMIREQHYTEDKVCTNCGKHQEENGQGNRCPNCGNGDWQAAMT